MIRGAQKKMIVVRTHDSRVFEEAYFVVRPDREPPPDEGDMLSEANRIIHKSTASPTDPLRYSPPSRIKPWLISAAWFLGGLLLGAGGAMLYQWITLL